MKAKDLPQEVKDMYNIKYVDYLNKYTISETESIGITLPENSEFTEDEINYYYRNAGALVAISKHFKHIAVIL